MKTDNALNVWFKTLETSLKIPGAIIDRELFLTAELHKYCKKKKLAKAIKTSPEKAGIKRKLIDKIAKRIILTDIAETSGLSFAAGLPGGLMVAATVPADLLQFHLHELILVQKLAYLYGRPTIIDKKTRKNKENLLYLTLLFGVMYGAENAEDALLEFEDNQKNIDFTKQFEQGAVTRVSVQIAKWLGVRILRGLTKNGTAKIVPLVGGFVSGGLSFIAVRKSAKRLHSFLQENKKIDLTI